jgi:hypothetical protein
MPPKNDQIDGADGHSTSVFFPAIAGRAAAMRGRGWLTQQYHGGGGIREDE